MASNIKECVTLEDIKNFQKENNLDDNIVQNISFLGISKLYIENNNKWTIIIKGPKKSLYEKGIYKITIAFPNEFPQKNPELRFVNKIYHLNVSPTNGYISSDFINTWIPSTSIAELLVGIYLFFFKQEPNSPYSGRMARQYVFNFPEFKSKAEEWVLLYANADINENKNEEKDKIKELENKYTLLEVKLKELENKFNQQNFKCLDEDNITNSMTIAKIFLLDKIKELKSMYPFELSPGEKLISVIFQCNGNLTSIICKDTDIFTKVEILLYEKYPEYKEKEQYFMKDGIKINKYKTLRENGIKDNDKIIMAITKIQ